MLDVRLIM